MENKLISMVDFVLGNLIHDANHSCHLMQKYATFLNQPLNLGMFVPAIEVGGKWEVLSEPNSIKGKKQAFEWKLIKEQYQQAKDKVLFEGVVKSEYLGDMICITFKDGMKELFEQSDTIEYLVGDGDYTLTAKGQELSGLNK